VRCKTWAGHWLLLQSARWAATALTPMTMISKSCVGTDGKMDDVDFAAKVIVEGAVEPKFSAAQVLALKKKNNTAINLLFTAKKKGKKK